MLSRRSMLQQAGLVGLGLAASDLHAFGWPATWQATDDVVVPFSDIPANFTLLREDGRVTGIDLRELRSFITPENNYFVVAHYNVPQIDPATWSLEVRGRVANPRSYTLADLKKRAQAGKTSAFECGGSGARNVNRLVGNATWSGTSLKSIIDEAKPLGDAREVVLWASDEGEETIRTEKLKQNFARSVTLDDLRTAEAMLVWEMNGQPLTANHGAPVRALFPGWYGVQNVKWLRSLEVSNERFMGRFQARDYVTIMGRPHGTTTEWVETSVTKMRTKSVIARVTRKPGGPLTVFGFALTDGTAVKGVEVQLNDGAWVSAKLDAPPNPHAWTWFRAELPAPGAGPHTIVSKATDALGRTQPVNLDLKKTYWEDYAQWRRKVDIS